jgi:arabinogalactan endo-1,4-beta-galactosidase
MRTILIALLASVMFSNPTRAQSAAATTQASSAPSSRPFLLGADISALTQAEQRGVIFRDDDKQATDAIALFTHHGWNCFRLRLFVNPNGRGGVINSLSYTRALGKRIKSSGATFLLDIHYSDTWADPQHQVKPAPWKDLPFDELEKQVEQYTAEVIHELTESGCRPDIVQIGNEITGGLLWPDAQVQVPVSTVKVYEGEVKPIQAPQPYDDARQWDRFARTIKAGARGVRGASSPDRPIAVMLHIDCGGDWPVTQWFFDHMIERNVEFDLIGQSYYPHWHGTLDNLRDALRQTAARYHKPIVIVETAYPWKNADAWSKRKNMAWPISREGQKQFMSDLIGAVRDTPDGLGAGVIWWHPESIPPPGADARTWNGGATALFDNEGIPLPALRESGR